MLDICRQSPGGFLQSVYQWSYLGSTRMRHQQTCDGQCDFFKLFQLASKLLAVLIQFLQRFIAICKIIV
jgi:hypothetical protein